MTWLTQDEIERMGFASVAADAKLSAKASYFNCGRIAIGSRSRVDDFSILSAGDGGVVIGANVHVAAFCFLAGKAEIRLEDFSGLSSRVSVYSSTDDYSGAVLTNPTVPEEFTGVRSAPVLIGRHVIVGSGSVLLPGTQMGEGAALGALSLANGRYEAFGIFAGIPARRLGERQHDLLGKELHYMAHLRDGDEQPER
ncbi:MULTISPECIES: acyltransferase [unclassified Variovorax]|uniref:acyltransferase n=1 Tax=unclassified Variovorax TaxID=663243 RepID=UPI000839A41C|nr:MULTISPECIES: acyltransferase [unclassified Variovorax]PNG58383.1 dTDP-4-amino-4,6-dideoxy-D-glucose acyltransferase [Variovorax sp. B4]PNG61827.1 dTDP-4-amino-4,6-dideoxy-D-glucose acyltransferase [Variovorax sp. B2]VTV12110.1 putative lipopolysaccharide biosynthesis O-acetyl transferase WbbJ [Variovorax sp. WDL1]